MSIDSNLYLGPYSVTKKKTVTEMVTVSGCAKCRKEISDDSDFCKKCGTRVSVFNEERSEITDPYELVESKDLTLVPVAGMCEFSKTHDFWVPNVQFMKRDAYLDISDNAEFQMDPKAMSQEVAEYEKFFKIGLKFISEEFGEVVTKWGLLVWYS